MPRWRPAAALAVLSIAVLLVVAACNRPTRPPPPTIPTEGFETRIDEKRGFSIVYPRAWEKASTTYIRAAVFRATLRAQLQRRGLTEEEAEDAADGLDMPFLANRRGIDDPAPLLIVVVGDADAPPFQLWSEIASAPDGFAGSELLSREELTVDGRPAVLTELVSEREDLRRFTLALLMVSDGDRAWSLHCQAAVRDQELARVECRQMIDSFHLLEPLSPAPDS